MSSQIITSPKLGIVFNDEVKELIDSIISFDNIQRDYKYSIFDDLLICLKFQLVNQDHSPNVIFYDCKEFILKAIEKQLPDNELTLRTMYKTIIDKNFYSHKEEGDNETLYDRNNVDMEKFGNYCRGLTRKITKQYEMIHNEFEDFLLALNPDNQILTSNMPKTSLTPTRTIERIRSNPDRYKPPEGLVKFRKNKKPKTIKDFLKITSAFEVIRMLIIVIFIITIHKFTIILGIRDSEK